MTTEKSAAAEQAKTEQQAHPYRPLGLKAVIAAALMVKPKQVLKPAR